MKNSIGNRAHLNQSAASFETRIGGKSEIRAPKSEARNLAPALFGFRHSDLGFGAGTKGTFQRLATICLAAVALAIVTPCLRAADLDFAEEEEIPERADLTGVVLDEAGEPVAGAYVFVESARPRKGTSSVCPSCYPDCVKRARTDAQGEFKLPDMDGALLFRLLLVAKGYEATAKDKMDPVMSPHSIALWQRPPPSEDQTLIHARVYDSEGRPAIGAYVEFEGAETGSMTTWGGHREYIQSIGVTDDSGVMTLVASARLKAGLGILQAQGHAKQWVRLEPGKDPLFVLREGVNVHGQIVKSGKPVPGLRIGFSGSDRTAGEFMRGWEVVTDADGRFNFANLTPGKQFNVYSMAKSSAQLGVLPVRGFNTGPDKSTVALGKIELQPPLHIRGRVVDTNGVPVLSGGRIMLGREQAWDYQETRMDDDGSFEFNGLAAEQVDISLREQDYKLSKKNPNRVHNRSISGQLRESLDHFLIVVEETDTPDDPNDREDHNWSVRETPLRGAPPEAAPLEPKNSDKK